MKFSALVIEDEPSLREVLVELLAMAGYTVLSAANGAEALEQLQQHHPDVILLDMLMPVMDGRTFARLSQQRPGPKAPIIVVAATQAAQRAAAIGAAGYHQKPFDLDQLLGVVDRHARRSAEPGRPTA